MPSAAQLSDKPRDGSERRRHLRQNVLFSSAELQDGNDGIILNISEGGVALHAFSEITTDTLSDLRLQLSVEQPWIEVKGKVVWRSPSRKTVGVRFVDLASSARERIKNWISDVREASSSESGVPDGAIASPADDLLPQAVSPATKTVGVPVSEQVVSEQPRQTIRLEIPASGYDRPHKRTVLITVVSSMLLIALVYFGWSKTGSQRSTESSRIGTTAPIVSPNSSDNSPTRPLNNAPPSQTPQGSDGSSPSGFVLQVAAIKNENNAIALASQLAQKQFPAFVVKSPGSDLYRVLVGPYGDSDTTAKAEVDLKKDGFPSIRQKNPATP
ncbi:MAG TPA: SPOR domain-containing protein [Candidatus Acidoferrales bacterium]|jgi:septal ring-binding cell division protein DamX|nr:SPOR domain-containing protein [Candidatus Acidoferrales bacterium]